jgi:hypothetical protein
VYLLWRDSADKVGKMPIGMADLVNDQHVLGQAAYEAVMTGKPAGRALGAWRQSWDKIAKQKSYPALRPLAKGIVKVFDEQDVLFGDLHSGNFGMVDGKWKITDPGHIAVIEH